MNLSCSMCDAPFDPYKYGECVNLKDRVLVCANCVQKIENYMNTFGVRGGILDTSKWGLNPKTIPIGISGKEKINE